MKKEIIKYTFFFGISILILSSCGSSQRLYNPKEVAYLSSKLEINLSNTNKEDDQNMSLYAEVSTWLGSPYRHGGTTKRGVDCSGFTLKVYKKVYRKKIPRSTKELANAHYPKVSKRGLQTGDLILFATGRNKKEVTHTGIYLKDGKFIHASTSRGVMVNHINDYYYKKAWVRAIRVK